MKKRGISHIEVMLSFIIFAGFVIFALYFFSPFKQNNKIIEASLNYVFKEIEKNISAEVESFSVAMDLSRDSSKIVKKIRLPNVEMSKIIAGSNRQGSIIPAKREGSSDNIIFESNNLHEGDLNNGFAYFRFSEDFELNDFSSTLIDPLTEDEYQISYYEKNILFSEKRIIKLNETYYNGYELLRERFNLPKRVNFGFRFELDTGNIIEAQKEMPKSGSIYSDSKRIEIIKINGEKEFANLIVNIW